MGANNTTARPISFVNPRLLSTDRMEEVESGKLWIYFPPTGFNTTIAYPNATRGWWVEFDRIDDIQRIEQVNQNIIITFKPKQAITMNMPENDQMVMVGTYYPITTNNQEVTIKVPYTNVD